MHKLILALATAAAIAACNPSAPENEASGAAGAGGAGFPNLASAAYRAEATITDPQGNALPVVMIRDGLKLRMEIAAPQGQSTVISNAETGESFVIASANGQTYAMRIELGDQFSDPAADWSGDMAASATMTGACSVAGENGSEWTRTDAEGSANTACVTADGILLKATEGARTTWETTRVERGAQSADLFTVPPGVQVMDLGAMGAAMGDALARAKAAAGQ